MSGLTAIVVAGITYAIVRSVNSQHISSVSHGIASPVIHGTGKNVVINNVSYISADRQGPPSWVVRCKETGNIFTSQHKAASGLTTVAVAGITYVIVRSTAALGGTGEDAARGGAINTASLVFRNNQTINITTVLDREGRLSGHLKGFYPDVDGLHFERVNLTEAK